MEYTTLGRTGLRVSRVGLGAGGPSRLGLARGAGQEQMERLIGRALNLGVNLIDTARGYGTEAAIGQALEALGARDVVVATKAVCAPADPTAVTREVEESLRDLRRETLDLFQFHGVEPRDLDGVVERLLPVAERLRAQGKVRFVGLTEHPSADTGQEAAARACASGLFDTVMVQYGVFDQAAPQRTLPAARAHGVGVLCMSAARGALVSEAALAGALAKLGACSVEDMRFLRDGGRRTWADLAFQFAAACDGIDVVLVGTGDPDHFEASARAVVGPPLPAPHLEWLRQRFGATAGEALWPE